MAKIYKTIKRHKGIEYVFNQNRLDSRYAYIEAYDRKSNGLIDVVATVDNKNHLVKYESDFAVPQIVKDVITHYAKGEA